MAKSAIDATDYLIKHYQEHKKGFKIVGNLPKPYGNYQCVGLLQEYLRQIGGFKDPVLPTAYDYAKVMKENKSKSALGYGKNNWEVVTINFKKGDIIFYKPTSANGKAGHVSIAINKEQCLQQNVEAPFMGTYPYLSKSSLETYGIIAWGIRRIEPTNRIGWAYFMGKSGRKCKVEIMPWDLYLTKINNLDQFAHQIKIVTSSKRNIYDAINGEVVGKFSVNSGTRYMYIDSKLEKAMKRG